MSSKQLGAVEISTSIETNGSRDTSHKHRLNDRGKAVLKAFLDKNVYNDVPINLPLRKVAVQQVVAVGNSWFKMMNLTYYIEKRQKANKSLDLQPTSPLVGSDEEELLFGSMDKTTRSNLRLLHYAKISTKTYHHWATQYNIDVQDIDAFFDWLHSGGADMHVAASDMFSELTFIMKEKLKTLVVGNPYASRERQQAWAKAIGAKTELVLAYIRQLQDNELRDSTNALDGTPSARENLHLPTPVSTSPEPRQLQHPHKVPLTPELPPSAPSICTESRKSTPAHSYSDARVHSASPERQTKSPPPSVKDEPLLSPTIRPYLRQGSAEPIPPGDSNPACGERLQEQSRAPSLPTAIDVHPVFAPISASAPPPKFRAKRTSSISCSATNELERPVQGGSELALESSTDAMEQRLLEPHAQAVLINAAARIDDIGKGIKGIYTFWHEENKRTAQLGGNKGEKMIQSEARRDPHASDRLDTNLDGSSVSRLNDWNADQNITPSRSARASPGSMNPSFKPSIASHRDQSHKARPDVHGLDTPDEAQPMDVDLEPAPTNYVELLKWMDNHQGPLDRIIMIGQQLKAASKTR